MTKEEKIKEAWGEYYELVKNELDEHGRYSYYDDNSIKRKSKLWRFENIETHQISNLNLLIPSSIKGIENNNGWIKIKSEEQIKDFQNEFCWVIVKSGEVEKMYIHSSNKSFVLNMCTHYQPIEKPKPPLY